MHADLVFLNGPIITVDPALPSFEAVAVHGNQIVLAGTEADDRAALGPRTRVVNLGGRVLLPGLNDNHNHPMSFGEMLRSIDAAPGAAPTLAKLQDAFRAGAETTEGDW